jgi:hypothetical protein
LDMQGVKSMNRWTKAWSMAVASCVLWFSFTLTTHADVTSGLLLTDILYGSDIQAQAETNIKVNVQEIIVDSKGKITKQEPFGEAVVTLTLTHGQDELSIKMTHRGEGTYVAAVTFPAEGSWLANARAEYPAGYDPGHNRGEGHHHDSKQDELDAKMVVKPPEASSGLTWMLAGGVVVGAVALLLVRRGRNA